MDNSYSPKRMQIHPLLLTAGGLIFVVLLGIYTYVANIKNVQTKIAENTKHVDYPEYSIESTEQLTQNDSSSPLREPRVFFSRYEKTSRVSEPAMPAQIKRYELSTSLTENETNAIARTLGVNVSKRSDTDNGFVTYYNFVPQSPTKGLLNVHTNTGAFLFQSYGEHRGNSSIEYSRQPEAYALSFLKTFGIDTETVTCPITFQKKDSSIMYVECHRNLTKENMPILGYPGVLNVPEGTTLASLRSGEGESTPPDDSIVSVSRISLITSGGVEQTLFTPLPNEIGRQRPDDFNTATVAIREDGSIASVKSNIRIINKSFDISADELLNPQEALNAFLTHKATSSLTMPAGNGAVDWKKVYPSNNAQSQKALINEYLLTYIESPLSVIQSTLEPYYLIRGTAVLDSGYTVQFVEMVPALKTSFLSSIMNTIQKEKGSSARNVSADTEGAPAVGQFGFSETRETPTPTDLPDVPTRTPTPTNDPSIPTKTPAPTKTPKPTPIPGGDICIEEGGEMGNVSYSFVNPVTITLASGETITVAVIKYNENLIYNHTYHLIASEKEDITLSEAKNALYGAVREQMLLNLATFMKDAKSGNNMLGLDKDQKINLKIGQEEYNTQHRDEFSRITMHTSSGLNTAWGQSKLNTVVDYMVSTMDRYNAEIFPGGSSSISAWAQKPSILNEELNDSLDYIFYEDGGSRSIICNYISGSSPTFFMYSSSPLESRVTLSFPITYSDAPIYKAKSQETTYLVYSGPNGPLEFGESKSVRPYLYYEYDPAHVSFNTFAGEWIFPLSQWELEARAQFVNELGLNDEEVNALILDIQKAISDDTSIMQKPYISLLLVDPKEVETRLPLSILPKPQHTYRIHFVVSGKDSVSTMTDKSPSISPLKRGTHYAVEVGARLK